MRRRRARAGFTLVEVMVTLAVTAVLFSLIGTILVSFISTQRKVEATLARERIGAAILELIARDVQGMYIYELQGVFKGVDSRGGGGDADGFEFVTTRDPSVRGETQAEAEVKAEEQARRSSAISAGGGADEPLYRDPPQLTKIVYSARESRGNPGLLTIFRSESLFNPPPPPPPGQAPGAVGLPPAAPATAASEHFMEVYDRVKSFNVRYLYQDKLQNIREWKDVWDDKDKYPAAIEILLEIVPDPKAAEQQSRLGMGEERARRIYRTIIAIPVTNPTPPQPQAGTAAPVNPSAPPK